MQAIPGFFDMPAQPETMGFSIGGWHPFSGGIVGILTGGTVNNQSIFSGGLPGLVKHLEEIAIGVNGSLLGGTVGGALNDLTIALDAPIRNFAKWCNDHQKTLMTVVAIVGVVVGVGYLAYYAYSAWAAEAGVEAVAEVAVEDAAVEVTSEAATGVIADAGGAVMEIPTAIEAPVDAVEAAATEATTEATSSTITQAEQEAINSVEMDATGGGVPSAGTSLSSGSQVGQAVEKQVIKKAESAAVKLITGSLVPSGIVPHPIPKPAYDGPAVISPGTGYILPVAAAALLLLLIGRR